MIASVAGVAEVGQAFSREPCSSDQAISDLVLASIIDVAEVGVGRAWGRESVSRSVVARLSCSTAAPSGLWS